MTSGRLVVVAGASGFLGRHICAALLEAGMTVRALVRGDARVPGCDNLSCVDVVSPPAAAFDGADSVVHAAGLAHLPPGEASDDDFRRINAEGTRIMAEAAAGGGAGRFIYVSSVAAAAQTSEVPLRASDEPRPLGPYGRSKLEGERLLLAVAARSGMRAAVLRPPMAYGAGMRGHPLRLFRIAASGLPLPLAAIHNRRSFVYAGNLAAAITVLLGREECGVYYVSDDRDLSTPEFTRLCAAALGAPGRLLPVPAGVLRAAGELGELVPGFPVGRDGVRGLTESLTLDISPLKGLGYRPAFTVEQGLQLAADWYRRRAQK